MIDRPIGIARLISYAAALLACMYTGYCAGTGTYSELATSCSVDALQQRHRRSGWFIDQILIPTAGDYDHAGRSSEVDVSSHSRMRRCRADACVYIYGPVKRSRFGRDHDHLYHHVCLCVCALVYDARTNSSYIYIDHPRHGGERDGRPAPGIYAARSRGRAALACRPAFALDSCVRAGRRRSRPAVAGAVRRAAAVPHRQYGGPKGGSGDPAGRALSPGQLVTSVTCSPPASAGRPAVEQRSSLMRAPGLPAAAIHALLYPSSIQLLYMHMPSSMDGCGNVVDGARWRQQLAGILTMT